MREKTRQEETAQLLQFALDAHEAGRLTDAEAAYLQVLERQGDQPDSALIYSNLANLMRLTRRFTQAEACYRRALELAPGFPEVYNNLGGLLEDLDRFAEAEAAYRHALALNPERVEARFNLGILLLALGRYTEGWPCYAARAQAFREHGALPFPQWSGEDLKGKSLLLLPEQGYGDTVQFVRYAAMLKALGVAKLSIVCNDAMQPLLQKVDGIDALVTEPGALRCHDYWDSLLNLPGRFGTTLETIPAKVPYITVLAGRTQRWKSLLPAGDGGRRVGLVWKGNAEHWNDANRSLGHFSALSALWSVTGVQFVSLQKGDGEDEPTKCRAHQPVVSLGPEIRDFADTAAIVAQLDLVICVDTAIAHVCGALGVPCWVMLPKLGVDWRWLKQGAGSPWYPGALRLFRQSTPDGWPAVIRDVAIALNHWSGATL